MYLSHFIRTLKSGIDNKTLDGLKKGKNVTLLTVERLCHILDCTPNDIVEFLPDDSEKIVKPYKKQKELV